MIKWENPMLISLSSAAESQGECNLGSGDSGYCRIGNSAGQKCEEGNAAFVECRYGNSPTTGPCNSGSTTDD